MCFIIEVIEMYHLTNQSSIDSSLTKILYIKLISIYCKRHDDGDTLPRQDQASGISPTIYLNIACSLTPKSIPGSQWEQQ